MLLTNPGHFFFCALKLTVSDSLRIFAGKKPTEVYIPPDLGDEDSLFKTGIHQGINFDKYDNIAVEMSGSRRTLPVDTFEEMGLLPTFLSNVKRAGYMKPTPIQKYAIPAIMAGRDLMACAQTGSGKTVNS